MPLDDEGQFDVADDDGTVYTFNRSQLTSKQDFLDQLTERRRANAWLKDPNRVPESPEANTESKSWLSRFIEDPLPHASDVNRWTEGLKTGAQGFADYFTPDFSESGNAFKKTLGELYHGDFSANTAKDMVSSTGQLIKSTIPFQKTFEGQYEGAKKRIQTQDADYGGLAQETIGQVSPLPLGPAFQMLKGFGYGTGLTDTPISPGDFSHAVGEATPAVALAAGMGLHERYGNYKAGLAAEAAKLAEQAKANPTEYGYGPDDGGGDGGSPHGEVSNIPPWIDPNLRAASEPLSPIYEPPPTTYVAGGEPGATSKVYPDMEPVQPAADTALAAAMRMNRNPEQVLYPREEPTGFQKYAAQDAAIQEDVARPDVLANERYRRFMEPSGLPQTPAGPGSERMGFDPESGTFRDVQGLRANRGKTGSPVKGIVEDAPILPEGPDAQLYATIPRSLWPRRAQTALESLVPERLKVEPPVMEEPSLPEITTARRAPKNGVINEGGAPLAEGGTIPLEDVAPLPSPKLSRPAGERGVRVPSARRIKAIAKEYGITPEAAKAVAQAEIDSKGLAKPIPETITQEPLPAMPETLSPDITEPPLASTVRQPEPLGDVAQYPGMAPEGPPRAQGPLQTGARPAEPTPYNPDYKLIQDIADSSLDPEVKQAAETLKPPTGKEFKSTGVKDLTKRTMSESDGHSLQSLGETGTTMESTARRKDYKAASFAGKLSAEINRVSQGMSDAQVKAAVDVIEGKAKTNDSAVQRFVDTYKANEAKLIELMKRAGSQMKSASGKLVPFQELANYWPHIFDTDFFKANKGKIISSIMKEKGLSAVDAENLLQRAREKSPILSDSLHERVTNLDGYRKDLDVLHNHYIEMTDRAFTDLEMGVNDMTNPDSTLSKMLKQVGIESGSDAEQRAREIMSKFLGHDGVNTMEGANTLTKFQALTKLGLSAPSNLIGGMAMMFSRAPVDAFASAVRGALTSEGKFRAQALGTLQSLFRDGAKDVGYGSKTSYGNNTVETFLRTVSGLAGENTANKFFEQLKKNPNNKYAAARLSDLLLEDATKLLHQDKLTPDQIDIAANRFTDLTQGRQNSLDLPHHWSNEPVFNILTQFKKFAFIQTKNLKDGMKMDLAHGKISPLLKLAVFSGLLGEIPADIKEIIRKGTLAGRPPIGLERLVDNAANAYGIGLMGDVLSSVKSGDRSRILGTMGGATAGMLADFGSGIGQSIEQSSIKPLAKSTFRQTVPIFGQTLADMVD